ncbi:MAG: Atu2307/SP_0267 family LLM class monooxygenase [Candidatus Nanopelagicaceae bacterium]
MQVTFGLDTFGDIQSAENGRPLSAAQTIRNVVAEAELADQLGINHFNVGEHHRDDFSVSAPDSVLAGIATRTKNITLGSGVTVLSSDDPVRVFQRFSTVDALSSGRAEITAGRGSFIESFPLFGYDLSDYGLLFEEKLELLVELLKERPVTWAGETRAPLSNQEVYPKTERGAIPLRVGVGGTPESVVRAARLNANLALAIIGGDPARFAPFSNLYRRSLEDFGHPQGSISIHSPGFVAESDEAAIEAHWPNHQEMFGRIGRERGWAPITKDNYLQEVRFGSLYVGSPETVAKKITHAIKSVGANRFDFKYANGPQTHASLLKCIELYATKVIPMVKEMLSA